MPHTTLAAAQNTDPPALFSMYLLDTFYETLHGHFHQLCMDNSLVMSRLTLSSTTDLRIRKRAYPLIALVLIATSGMVSHWQEHHYNALRFYAYPPLAASTNFKIPLPWECYRCGFFEINCQVKCKEEMAEKQVAYDILNEKYVKQQYQA
eukprot:CAMPEP_0117440380 /NCGR_PEP_ID=MMETSP0759-20121206/3061_1 /TAXON_ID=63605 /ORGANISM="Percolomonas cosmopolitus, Strain WS" /LENGTH=149 /DNA_ID=CAMNT_0005232145 /DNA_START=313 /DNA_END=762 /DNA_ORIENTATION=-